MYNCKSFTAEHIQDTVFQIRLKCIPIIYTYTFGEFNVIRQDLLNFKNMGAYFRFSKEFESFRIYGEPRDKKYYITFRGSEFVTIGMTVAEFYSFKQDIISFNPEGEFYGYENQLEIVKQHVPTNVCKNCGGVRGSVHTSLRRCNCGTSW